MDVPKITFKNHRDDGVIYAISMRGLPYQSPWGNLQLKMHMIATTIRYLNEEKIPSTVKQYLYEKDKLMNSPVPVISYIKHHFYLVEIVAYLKNIADQLIAIASIAEDFTANKNQWPIRPKVDSIGRFLESKELIPGLKTNIDYLHCLNDLANAKKHWLLDTDFSNRMGRDEPVIYALGTKGNNRSTPETERGVSLAYLINGFSKFMNDYQNYGKEKT